MQNNKIQLAISAVLALGLTCGANAATPESKPANNSMSMQPLSIKGQEKCYGIVKAGLNDCGSSTHNCAGEAPKDGQKTDWMMVPTGLCKKIVGGSLVSS